MLYNVVLTLLRVRPLEPCGVISLDDSASKGIGESTLVIDLSVPFMTIQMKAIEHYLHVVLFIMLYKVVLTLKCVDETLVWDQSNESYWAVLSCGTVYYAVQGVDELKP